MSYIGNPPSQVAFLTNQYSGDGTTTAFTMSVAPATTTSVLVAITGVLQDPTTYSVVGTTLTFSAAPPTGTGNISVRYMGIPASGVATTAYRTVTEFTATAGQTTFTPPSYTVGFINVYRNGVRLGSADYTASNGTTVVLTAAATVGDLVVTESFYVSSVLNAIPATAGAVQTAYIADANVTAAKLASGAARSNFGAGAVLQVVQAQLTSVQSFSTSPAYTWVSVTGASASITPSSATSKILVQYSCMAHTNTPSSYYATYTRMLRNGTPVAVGGGAGLQAGTYTFAASINYSSSTGQVFLDSPATTSTLTYQLQVTGENTTTVVGGTYNSYPSGAAPSPNIPTSIILMEIAA